MFEVKAQATLPLDLRQRESLNLGCGLKHIQETVNLDITPETHPDVVHDLNQMPWPLPDDHLREVVAYDVHRPSLSLQAKSTVSQISTETASRR